MNRFINNWKTTSAGLVMIGGAIVHLAFAVKNKTADENTWTITIGAIIGGLGLILAGDANPTPGPTQNNQPSEQQQNEKTNP